MMKVYPLFAALCLVVSNGFAQFNYVFTTTTATYTDLTGATSLNNGEVWDDPDYSLALPFPFELNGNDINSLTFIGLGTELGAEIAQDIATIVAPFSADLIDRGYDLGVSQSPISYKVEGNPGTQILIIEWKNAGSYEELTELGTADMFVNLQLWLFEGSNRIEMHYGPSMITDADLFYAGEVGPLVAIVDANLYEGTYMNPHFLTGPASDPDLTEVESFVDGTPDDGMVYAFSLNVDLEVEVVGTDGTCGLPNGTATANATGGVEPYTYEWNNGGSTQTITDLEPGTYSVTVTDANSSTAAGNVVISNTGEVFANATATDETSLGANDGTATAAPEGGTPPYSYNWSNGSTDATITGLAPGVYTVTVTDNEGCTDVQSVTVNAFGCPDLFLESGISNLSCYEACDGLISVLEVVNGTAPFTYAWSTGSTESFIGDICAGFYSVTVTDANGCIASELYEIFQPAELLAHAGSTDETSDGANDGTAWSAPTGGIDPYTFLWSNGITDAMITGLAPGSYTVTVTDANYCLDTQTVIVNGAGCQLGVQGTITNATCADACDGSITLILTSAEDPVTYAWSDGSTDAFLIDVCAGSYSVTVTDGEGCVVSQSYAVSEPAPLFANAASSDETSQGANDGSAWVAPAGGVPPYTYAWSNGSVDSLLTGLAPGDYTVTVTDANGCTDVETVTVNPFVCIGIVNTSFSAISCFGLCDGAAAVTVNGGVGPFTYFWNTGDTTTSISGLCAGTYSVSIYDAGQNCTAIAGFFLSEPEPLIASIEGVVHITDSTASSINITVTGGTQPYAYAWTGPDGFTSTSEDLAGINPGLYRIDVTDANGCTAFVDSIEVRDETVGISDLNTLNVEVYPNPATDFVTLIVQDASKFEVALIGYDGRIVRSWQNANIIDVSGIVSGIYSLYVTSAEGRYVGMLVVK